MQTLETLADAVLPAFRDATREAGALALRYFEPGFKTSARVWSKSGGSPVTEADMTVDSFLKARLGELLPEAGWLSEETADDERRLGRRFVWVVDPIDGTRAFASGSLDWSVSAALLADGVPFVGIVYAPAHAVFYEACRDRGARRDAEPIATAPGPAPGQISVAGPTPLVDRLERGLGPVKRVPRIPSLALRLARVADGSLDAGVVSSNAHDWDLAAADLILHEAGGRLTGLDGARPAYNQPEPVHGELLAAARQLHPMLIEAMTARRAATPSARG
jgi:myo-inositol-1(or 4)-monophosphatase